MEGKRDAGLREHMSYKPPENQVGSSYDPMEYSDLKKGGAGDLPDGNEIDDARSGVSLGDCDADKSFISDDHEEMKFLDKEFDAF